MENTNSKIITASLLVTSVLIGVTIHLLLQSLAGAFGVVARMIGSDLVRHGFPILMAAIFFFSCQLNAKFKAWAEEVVIEVRKVVFPTRKDTIAMTISVIIMVLVSSLIIMAMDWLSGISVNSLLY